MTSRCTPWTSRTGPGPVYSVSETFAGLTYAENFSDRFSAGITAKFVFDQLGEASGSAFAVDFGTNFHADAVEPPGQVLASPWPNLGTNLSYRGDALNAGVPRDPLPGEDPVPSLPQPAPAADQGVPAADDLPGGRWPTTCWPGRTTG